jgi:hypothetical protein
MILSLKTAKKSTNNAMSWWKISHARNSGFDSRLTKRPDEDAEEHAKRIAIRAWNACLDVMED